MKKLVVNFSGGKDSTVAILEAMKQYPKGDIELVFMDTGAEYKGTRNHVVKVANMLELPLTILEPKRDWFEQIRHDGMPFTPALRKCTWRLKVDIYHKWLTQYRRANGLAVKDIITVTGIRGEESLSRSKMTEWQEADHGQGFYWRPCLAMREQEVKERIRAAGLPLHYCYEFSGRCNCWLCIFAGYNEIRTYAEMNPDEWEKACLLEDEIRKPLLGKHKAINDIMKQGRLFLPELKVNLVSCENVY